MDSKRKIIELDLNSILPNRFQPRIAFDETGLIELTESIKVHGVINPIIVRKLGEKFEIIAGERRYKASILAGLKTIPAIITDFNDKESSEIALIENVQRRDLTPIEEAISYKRILDMNYITQDELAKKLGKTQSTIANKLRLLNLCDDVQEALLEGKISERHARSLLKIKNSAQQKLLLDRIINERLTVRRTDEEIDKMFNENENQKSKYINTENLNIPTSNIIGDDNIETINTNVSSGVDMLYNQATMNIPKIMGEDIKQYEENQNSKPILNEPVEELHFGFEDNNDVNNPGFMDISNIESNAKDIFENKPARPFFFSEPEPVAPASPVMPDISEEPVVTTVEDEKTPLINPMFMQTNEEPVTETPVVEEITPQPVVSSDGFDFDFIPAETVKTNQVDIPELSDLEQFSSFNTTPVEEVASPVMPDATVNSDTEVLNFDEPVETVIEPIYNENPQPEVSNVENPVISEPVVAPVVEPIVEPVTTTFEEPVVSETPVVENVSTTTDVQSEEKEEPKKEEKKSFFDRLKALVDTKPEKLEEPVVEPMISNPIVEEPSVMETVSSEPEVLNVEESVIPESVVTPVVEPIVENVVPTFEEPIVSDVPAAEQTISDIPMVENNDLTMTDNLVTSQPEVLSFDSMEDTNSNLSSEPIGNSEDIEVLDFSEFDNNTNVEEPVIEENNQMLNLNPEVLSFEEPVVSEMPVTEQTIPNIPMVENNDLTMTDNLVTSQPEVLNSNEFQLTPDIPFVLDENNVNVNDAINSLEETANESRELVDSIDTTPIIENDGVEKIENIPEDIMSTLNNEVDDLNTKEFNDMPAELAEIVANPELTNNFSDNEDIPTEPVINVEPIVNQDTPSNNYEMPFQTILDDVVIPEENTVETPVEVPEYNNNLGDSDLSVVNGTTDVENTDSEFEEFKPATLPIYDDEVENPNSILNIPYTPVYEDNVITDIPSTTEEPVVNMGGAMRVIRNAVEELQKLGFIVDTEEFDFENMYQVVFKINKNSK